MNGQQSGLDNCEASGAVYAFEITSGSSATAFCFGDGCPCGNDDPLAGCTNGTGTGALLSLSGSTRVAQDDLVLTVQSLPPDGIAVAVMGSEATSLPFGEGILCVSGNTFHFPPRSLGASGSVTLGPGIALESRALFGAPGFIAAGSTWVFQVSYRDTSRPCGADFNTSNALSIAFSP